jgi:YVTN family beta-propeller protein
MNQLVVLGAIALVGIVALARLTGGPGPTPSTSSASLASAIAASSGRPLAKASATLLEPSFSPAGATASPSPTTAPTPAALANVYAATGIGMFSPVVARDPARVYVPDETSGTVSVIDPRTFRIIARYAVGASPEHITPAWDLQRLYVEATFSGRLAIIDPATGKLIGYQAVVAPYNLYFSVDGRWALDVVDRARAGEYAGTAQVYVYDRRTWQLRKAIDVPWAGANHLDFTADGRFAILSAEYAGVLVKIDMNRLAVIDRLVVGGSPTDVRLAPDGRVVYVANQSRNGVSVVDPVTMREVRFIPTGLGAHGLAVSRDARSLYVTNRLEGTLSVIDFARRRVVATWRIGGSPDMIAVSPDGGRLWISNRFNGTISVVDAHSGHVIRTIQTGGRPHGLAFFPEPGRLSLGHNGNFR